MGNHTAYIGNIDVVLEKEILGPYSAKVAIAVERGIDKTGRNLKRDSKKGEAPDEKIPSKWVEKGFPDRGRGGTYKKHIAHRRRGKGFDHSYLWYVKSPEYRLTHLLAHGHRLYIFGRNTGRRTKPNDWLEKAHARAAAELRPNIIKELPR